MELNEYYDLPYRLELNAAKNNLEIQIRKLFTSHRLQIDEVVHILTCFLNEIFIQYNFERDLVSKIIMDIHEQYLEDLNDRDQKLIDEELMKDNNNNQ